jgi:hypothetical protein
MTNLSGWLWPVEIAGDVRTGQFASLLISAVGLADAMVRGRLRLAVNSFADLANCGGLGGASLKPTRSWARLLTDGEPDVKAGTALWRFSSLAVDPRALAVMLNLLEGTGDAIRLVRLRTGGPDVVQALAVDDYPAVTGALPFRFDSELTSRNVDVEVIFPGTLAANLHESVIDPVDAWSLVGFLGGFRTADLPPLESNFLPVSEPEIILDALSFSLEKSTAHLAAFDSLANVLALVSDTVTPIEEVRFSG